MFVQVLCHAAAFGPIRHDSRDAAHTTPTDDSTRLRHRALVAELAACSAKLGRLKSKQMGRADRAQPSESRDCVVPREYSHNCVRQTERGTAVKVRRRPLRGCAE